VRKKRKSSSLDSSRSAFNAATRRRTSIPRDRYAAWDFSWTLDRLRASQPNPFVNLVPRSLRGPHPQSFSSARRRSENRNGKPFVYVDQGGVLIDARTGEILSAKRVAERLTEDPCRKAREARRASILSSGYGGRNGFTDYSKHKEC